MFFVQHIEKYNWVDIYAIVCELRKYRKLMVQTEVRLETELSYIYILYVNDFNSDLVKLSSFLNPYVIISYNK